MSATHRRRFLARTAAFASVSSGLFADPLTKSNLGVQLYTVRNILPKDAAGVLKSIKNIGYTEIEATDYGNSDAVWGAISNSGMKLTSVHMDAGQLQKSSSELETKMAQFKKLGFQYVVFPYVKPELRGDASSFKKLAESLDKAGAVAKQNGLTLCYHNHAFEFEEKDGTSPLEIIMGGTSKDHLMLEMDIFWVTVAGHDPVQLLRSYAGRVPLLHIKDKAKGLPAKTQFNESVPKETFKEAGNGSIDLPAVLKEADMAGVKHYFVEQDQTPDPIKSLRESYSYLSSRFSS